MLLDLDKLQPPITANQILSQYNEEYLYKMYCSDFPKNLCHSPFRKDKTPSFSFYRRSRWYWKDLATNEKGDVFTFIQKMENAADLSQTLKILMNRLSLKSDFGGYVKADTNRVNQGSGKKLLQFILKPFDEIDMKAWLKWGIPVSYVHAFNGVCVRQAFLNKELIWTYQIQNPIYAFHFKESNNAKGYRPFEPNKKRKFIGVIDGKVDIYGLQEFRAIKRRHKIIVLTKAMKEVMFFKSFGITAIALCGEGYYFPESVVHEILDSADHVISFYDNDRSGAHGAWNLRNQYGIKAVFINPNIGIKNVTDMWEVNYKMCYDIIQGITAIANNESNDFKYLKIYDKRRSKRHT